MKVTHENYFSKEMSWAYCGSSQFKDFAGTLGKLGCEAQAMAKLEGLWDTEQTTALLVGSYVDSHFEGTLDLFRAHHPEIYLKSGDLKSDYRKANEIITFLEKDPLFMAYMAGEKQHIFTGEIEGLPFKIKIDSFHKGAMIVDLKVMASLTKRNWVKDFGKLTFVEYWGYDIQGAIYQEITRQATGEQLPFFIAGATKENVTNKELIWIDQRRLDESLDFVKNNIDRIKALKAKEEEPRRCEQCDYCRATKMLEKPIHYSELKEDI